MRDNTVEVVAGELRFAPRFNVAVPFVDRHLEEGRGNKVAIRTAAGEEVTYVQLADRVDRCGAALKSLGLGSGERVLLVVKDCPGFFYAFWGAIKAGIVPVPLNTMLREADYRFIFSDSGCRAVIYSPELAAEVEPALDATEPQPLRILTEGEGTTLAALVENARPSLEPAPATAESPCFWLYSSGSTGPPKGAVHLHRDMVVTSQRYGVETLEAGADDVFFSAAKLFFAYGLGNGMTFPLWVGATTTLLDGRPTPDATFRVIEERRPTLFFGVPTLYAQQLQALETRAPDLGSLRLCISAGEALPADILHRWRERTGLTILDGIGSTEILHIFISNREGDVCPGSSGRVVPGYEARIVDDEGADVPTGTSGHLLMRGASISPCYWNNPERTAQTMLGEWIRTGDTYFQDPDGFYHYCGRSDDMLKVGGIWCSPFEIESRLIEHPAVLEAAVVGLPDADDLVKPHAYVILAGAIPGDGALAATLLAHCKDGLAPYKYPRKVHFVKTLPKTATGKIQRFRLRQVGS